jgi:transposase
VTKQLDIPRGLLKRLYYDEGLSRQKIADRLGCTEWIVRSQMERYGLPARRPWDYRRIDIPKGLLQRLYYEEGLSQAKIAKRLGCDEGVIIRRMREFGMEPKSPADYRRLDIPETLLRKLYCRDGLSLAQIAERLECSQTVILRRLQAYGIDRRPRGGGPKYSVPENVLNTWTPGLAYIVGLVTADGNLKKADSEVGFASTDAEIVEVYRRILKTDAPIYVRQPKNRRNPIYSVRIRDCAYRAFLENVGLMPAKAKRLKALNIPDTVFPDFLRGCIDGDGSICVPVFKQAVYKNGDRRLLTVRLYSSSLPFLKWVSNTVARLVRLQSNVNEGQQGYGCLAYTGRKAIVLLHWIYYAPDIPCLTRKRDVFESYLGG